MKKGLAVFAFATAFAALLLAGASAEGAVYRVSQKGSPAADGSSWEKAMDTIAFYQKLRKAKPGDEFWVAAGTYYPYNFPSPTGDRELSFSVSLMILGLIQRYMFIFDPALSLVPEALAPPKGCCPTTGPVGLSLM